MAAPSLLQGAPACSHLDGGLLALRWRKHRYPNSFWWVTVTKGSALLPLLCMVSIIAARVYKHHPTASDLHPQVLKHKPHFSTPRYTQGMGPYLPPAYLPHLTALWWDGSICGNHSSTICVNGSCNKNKHSNKQTKKTKLKEFWLGTRTKFPSISDWP